MTDMRMPGPAKVVRDVMRTIDERCGTRLKPMVGNLYRAAQRWVSPWRRLLDPLCIRLAYGLGLARNRSLRLHLGCGHKHIDGYVNADLWLSEATDVVCDITRLPWPDHSVSIIESYHVIEHIPHTRVADVLREWHRVLAPGGRLVIECPDFDQGVKEYLAGDEARLLNIYGQQRYPGDTHQFGYNPRRLRILLESVGFGEATQAPPQSSQRLEEPSFRVECRKLPPAT